MYTEVSKFVSRPPFGARGDGSVTICLIDDSQHPSYLAACAHAAECCRLAGVADIRNAKLEDVKHLFANR